MLWAIDVGNTQTVVGLHDDRDWVAAWRFATSSDKTEDELAADLSGLCRLADLPWQGMGMVVGSVVPSVEDSWRRFGTKHLALDPVFLKDGASVGLTVTYDPPHAVGADRIANALAALEFMAPPFIVVDFGTATTLDCVDARGHYIGGVILPGPLVSLQALVGRTAKLPSVALVAPAQAIGRNTASAIQSGAVFGYADAVQGLIERAKLELGDGCQVISTGGLGETFLTLCPSIRAHHPNLTLDGLRLAYEKLSRT